MLIRQQLHDRLRFLRPWLKRGDAVHTVANMTFAGDGIITRHDISRLQDQRARRIREAAFWDLEPQPFHEHLAWRIHIATWAATTATASVPGDLVEFGVHYGVFSRAICEAIDIDNSSRNFYLVDSWGPMEGSHPAYGQDIFAEVGERFKGFQSVKMIRGTVPSVLATISNVDQIAYLSLDMNDGFADHEALRWAWSKMPKGAIIYIDDWGWDYPELRRLVGGFLTERGCDVLTFPTGNAIAMKSVP